MPETIQDVKICRRKRCKTKFTPKRAYPEQNYCCADCRMADHRETRDDKIEAAMRRAELVLPSAREKDRNNRVYKALLFIREQLSEVLYGKEEK